MMGNLLSERTEFRLADAWGFGGSVFEVFLEF